MPVRRDKRTDRWYFRTTVKRPDGTRERLFGTPGTPGPYQSFPNTKVGAQAAEQAAIRKVEDDASPAKEVPTFAEWFNGRFWREWVVGRKNKPTEVRSKRTIYDLHLGPFFGPMPLTAIGVSEVAKFRAALVESGELGEKRINNILVVLSKALRYAEDAEMIEKRPKIGMFKIERPEIVVWGFDEYPRLLEAAKIEGEEWHVAVLLAGEQGQRIGEVKALRWREDVDMIARTITVNQQICNGVTTTPKGRTRRTMPMTDRTYDALRRMPTIREGFVVRGLDGEQKTDGTADNVIARICRRAGLPVRYWHTLRHTFGTHAAMFGVNPWRLQSWLGHKRIDETMLYVHFAENHLRELPDVVRAAAAAEQDPDRRVLAMLGARGSHVAAAENPRSENSVSPAG